MANASARIGWYMTRLRSMERGELRFRLRELARRKLWALTGRGWKDVEHVGEGELGPLIRLRRRMQQASDQNTVMTQDALATLRAGRFSFLGHDAPALFTAEGNVDPSIWLRDPISGATWPGEEVGASNVAVRWTGAAAVEGGVTGDVKYVWEPNRLQFLQPAGFALGRTGDAGDVEHVMKVLRNWADHNPPGRGVNWVSGLELALRMVSIAVISAGIGPENLTKDDRVLLRRIAAAHGRRIAAFPSRFSSANNHLIGEALGLLACAALAPDLPDVRGWKRTVRATLDQEAFLQIHPDGVGAEQSPAYLAFILEMYAVAILLGEEIGLTLSGGVTERLNAAADFLMALADEAGNIPVIGDDDEGRVIASHAARESAYPLSVAASIKALVGKTPVLPADHIPGWREALFGVEAGAQLKAHASPQVQVFSSGGYTIVDDEAAGRRLHLVFDHGPLGHTALAAHGHADALAVWLSVDGIPVFVDAGTYLYHAGGEQRRVMREAASHNCLTVADVSPSRAAGAFAWTARCDAHFEALQTGGDWIASGFHDGYAKELGARCRRRLSRTADGFAIDDALEGAQGVQPVSIRFLCASGLDVTGDGTTVSVSDKGVHLLDLTAPEGFRAELSEAAISPRFGALENATQITLSGILAANDVARTSVELIANPAHQSAVTVKHDRLPARARRLDEAPSSPERT